MAKAKKVEERLNKAALIRDWFTKNPKADNVDCVKALTEAHGAENAPSPAQVSNVRKSMNEGKTPGKRGRPAGSKNATTGGSKKTAAPKAKGRKTPTNGELTMDVAKRLATLVRVDFAGDVEAAKAGLDEYSELLV